MPASPLLVAGDTVFCWVSSYTQNSGIFATPTAGSMAKDQFMNVAQLALLLTFRSLLAQYRPTSPSSTEVSRARGINRLSHSTHIATTQHGARAHAHTATASVCFLTHCRVVYTAAVIDTGIITLRDTNTLAVGGAKFCLLAGIANTVPDVHAAHIKLTPLSSVGAVLVGFDAAEAAASLL